MAASSNSFPFNDSGFLANTQFVSGNLNFEELNVIIETPLVSHADDPIHQYVSHKRSLNTREKSSNFVETKLESSDDQVIATRSNLPDKKRKNSALSSFTSNNSKENGRGKIRRKQKNCNGKSGEEKKQVEEKQISDKAENKRPPKKVSHHEETSTGYVHVRARRGQATDSHSLAERVRREKISERMKALQRLVPGCDKVTGKALVLDEIINYVQSLKNQIEFLSMKLASINPFFYDSTMDHLNAFMMSPEERLNNTLPSPPSPSSLQLQSLQQCSPNQPMSLAADSNNTLIASNANVAYPLLDSSSTSMLFLQEQSPYVPCQVDLLWDTEEEQRQKFLNPNGLGPNLSSLN